MANDKDKETMKGEIFDIQRFSIHDGPGIRTTIFLMSCPLNCLWCHNPECNVPFGTLIYDEAKCRLCRNCIKSCAKNALSETGTCIEIDRDICNLCGICAKKCVYGALKTVGRKLSATQVFDITIKDKNYYKNSNGGITISGGEPFAQIKFTLELLKLFKSAGINTALDTCGYADIKAVKVTLKYTDLFLFDIKHVNRQEHKRITGKNNEKILKVLDYLDSEKSRIWIRIPVIPGYNDKAENFKEIAVVMKKYLSIERLELLPYHPLAEKKYIQLGLKYQLKDLKRPDPDDMEKYGEILRSAANIEVIVRYL